MTEHSAMDPASGGQMSEHSATHPGSISQMSDICYQSTQSRLRTVYKGVIPTKTSQPLVGECRIAARSYGKRRYLMVIYKQLKPDDGFIITAYFSRKLNRKQILWKKH